MITSCSKNSAVCHSTFLCIYQISWNSGYIYNGRQRWSTILDFQQRKCGNRRKQITHPTGTARALIANFFNRRAIRPLSSSIKWVGKRSWINLVRSHWKTNCIYASDHATQSFDVLQWNIFKVHSSLQPTTTQVISVISRHVASLHADFTLHSSASTKFP